MAVAGPDRSFELRARNNLAASLVEDDPAMATTLAVEAANLARQVGDRSMYNWTIGTAAGGLYFEGRDWDENGALVREALEQATLMHDRTRLRIMLSFHEIARGENTEQILADLAEFVGDSTEPDDLFSLYMARAGVALVNGDTESAFRNAMAILDLDAQNPEIAMLVALRAAIWSRDLERTRRVAALRATLPAGPFGKAEIAHGNAAVAALEGRTADALAGFRDVRTTLDRLQQHFDAALRAVDAAVLLPDEAEIHAWADEARPLLEDLRARPYLAKLDEALASASSPAPRPGSAATPPEQPVPQARQGR
jgi:hypothetical protein